MISNGRARDDHFKFHEASGKVQMQMQEDTLDRMEGTNQEGAYWCGARYELWSTVDRHTDTWDP